ncbi:MAG: hypothetical protein WCT99_05105 [Bacteroidota bacterium]|jgi:membrane-bound metal-dependent hydrolase YbcI (DUF457 family)
MFIGHFAVALAAKKAAPKTNLATLFAAAQLVDLLWPVFLLLGLEHVRLDVGNTVVTPLDFYDYPITHSLAGAFVWSVLFGAVYYFRRKLKRESLIVAGVVFSHWILDLLTHRPDLPLFNDTSMKFGLGLWNSFYGTIVVEFGLFIAGSYLYYTATTAKNRTGTYALIGLLVLLAGFHLANLFGPPPPNVEMIAVAGNAMWLFVLWGWWIDKNRTVKPLTTE